MKGFFKSFEFYAAVALFVFILFFGYLYLYTPNYFNNSSVREFTIKEGETLSHVIDRLYRKGLIRNRSGMKLAAYITGSADKIRAGKFMLHTGSTFFEMLNEFTSGGTGHQTKVTIPEGIWQNKLAGLLHHELKLDSTKIMRLSFDRKFLKSLGLHVKKLEGYLLPDTYFFDDDWDEREVLSKLKYENDKIFKMPRVKKQMSKLNMTRHEILTLASIIDGESNKTSEFKLISAVYHNRLNKGMALQADPTIQYLIRNRRRHNKIYYKDLKINSHYNTYKFAGLPPGPINNPGRDAIFAALFPADVNYLYFVADGKGGHLFASRYSEQVKNVRKYRIWRSKKSRQRLRK